MEYEMACDCYAHNVRCSGTLELANHLINGTNEQLSAKMKMQQEWHNSPQSAQQRSGEGGDRAYRKRGRNNNGRLVNVGKE